MAKTRASTRDPSSSTAANERVTRTKKASASNDKTVIIFFNFHHATIETYDVKTKYSYVKRINLLRSSTFSTYMEELFNGGWDLHGSNIDKDSPAFIESIKPDECRAEIQKIFHESHNLLRSKKHKLLRVFIVCDFEVFPWENMFQEEMKKFPYLEAASQPCRSISHFEALWTPFLHDAGLTEPIPEQQYIMLIRQSIHRLDIYLAQSNEKKLRLVNQTHRYFDRNLTKSEVIDIVDTLRTIKDTRLQVDIYVLEFRRKHGEKAFLEYLYDEKTILLNYDEGRYGLLKKYYDRMDIDLNMLADKDEEQAILTARMQTMSMQGNASGFTHGLYRENYKARCASFPLKRPPPGFGKSANIDPYGETSISPLQWNRFLRTAKQLPEDLIPRRVGLQKHMNEGSLPVEPPPGIVEQMCIDAIRQEDDEDERCMVFDDEWLAENEEKVLELERSNVFIDYEKAIEKYIDRCQSGTVRKEVEELPTCSQASSSIEKCEEETEKVEAASNLVVEEMPLDEPGPSTAPLKLTLRINKKHLKTVPNPEEPGPSSSTSSSARRTRLPRAVKQDAIDYSETIIRVNPGSGCYRSTLRARRRGRPHTIRHFQSKPKPIANRPLNPVEYVINRVILRPNMSRVFPHLWRALHNKWSPRKCFSNKSVGYAVRQVDSLLHNPPEVDAPKNEKTTLSTMKEQFSRTFGTFPEEMPKIRTEEMKKQNEWLNCIHQKAQIPDDSKIFSDLSKIADAFSHMTIPKEFQCQDHALNDCRCWLFLIDRETDDSVSTEDVIEVDQGAAPDFDGPEDLVRMSNDNLEVALVASSARTTSEDSESEPPILEAHNASLYVQ